MLSKGRTSPRPAPPAVQGLSCLRCTGRITLIPTTLIVVWTRLTSLKHPLLTTFNGSLLTGEQGSEFLCLALEPTAGPGTPSPGSTFFRPFVQQPGDLSPHPWVWNLVLPQACVPAAPPAHLPSRLSVPFSGAGGKVGQVCPPGAMSLGPLTDYREQQQDTADDDGHNDGGLAAAQL